MISLKPCAVIQNGIIARHCTNLSFNLISRQVEHSPVIHAPPRNPAHSLLYDNNFCIAFSLTHSHMLPRKGFVGLIAANVKSRGNCDLIQAAIAGHPGEIPGSITVIRLIIWVISMIATICLPPAKISGALMQTLALFFLMLQCTKNTINTSGFAGANFMLPKPNDRPVGCPQAPKVSLIAFPVCVQLQFPKLR